MLARLSIRDIVLIDRLDLEFGAGLAVLTGETGAGKSILLDALSLALGARGEGGLVRQGASQGQVSAVFDVPAAHPARQALAALDIEAEGDIILRRVQLPDGRSRAFICDQPSTMQALRQVGMTLVEIHGQHADRAMVDPATHRQLVDGFGGLNEDVEAIGIAHQHWKNASHQLDEHRARIEAARREGEYLRHAARELDDLAPEQGEETALAGARQGMMQAEKTIADLRDANDMMSGNAAPGPVLVSVMRRLERRREGAEPELKAAIEAIDAALISIEEAQSGLERALRLTDFNPRELERIEERLFTLRAAARKYHVPVDGLAALAAKYAADLDALDHGEEQLVRLERGARESQSLMIAKAEALSIKRRNAALALDEAIAGELPPLKLERARFSTQIISDPARPDASGIDRIEFHVSTNPGTSPGPMMKIASGGELARFMLALKVALADRGSAPTLVFDEIDTGVGGAVADAIGARLARLADQVQVLAVTHAPQVAARALTHFRIEKSETGEGERVATRVHRMDIAARREEIARMLSGADVTDEARAAAGKLLNA